MNLEEAYELEALVVGNLLNDPELKKSIAVLPEYFFDPSCANIVEYVTERKEYNLYDMCKELDINFELVTELADNPADKKTFQYRVTKLIDIFNVRERIWDEMRAARVALDNNTDPIRIASILRTNVGKILDQGTISAVSD